MQEVAEVGRQPRYAYPAFDLVEEVSQSLGQDCQGRQSTVAILMISSRSRGSCALGIGFLSTSS